MSEDSSDERLRATVGESFNIYQATVAMISIFAGFVIAALLLLLGQDSPPRATITLLVVCMLSLLASLMAFYATANEVIRYWRIFLPRSRTRTIGVIFYVVGIISMLGATSAMLWSRGFLMLAVVVVIAALCFISFEAWPFKFHKGGTYSRRVDGRSPSFR